MDDELRWAVVWALIHVPGVIVMLVLRGRSVRQLHVAERWRAEAAPSDRPEADDLVTLTRDRHRRNGALALVIGSYLLLGLLALSYALTPWFDDMAYRLIARLILIAGEAVLITSAWLSVIVGDRIAPRSTRGAVAQEQQDRIEATGEESVERLRRGHIGDRERP